jgi:hypothetical protein
LVNAIVPLLLESAPTVNTASPPLALNASVWPFVPPPKVNEAAL